MTGWAVVARFLNIGEAEIAASALDAAGIDCDLVDEAIVRVDWLMAQAVGGIKLVVRSEDLEEARAVLTTAPPTTQPKSPAEDPSAALGAGSGAPTVSPSAAPVSSACPECGSDQFAPIPRLRIFLLLVAVFLGVGVVAGEPLIALTAFLAVGVAVLMLPEARCIACGHRFNPPQHAAIETEEAPGPDPKDMIEQRCPRCGSEEEHAIDYRRMKAIPMLVSAAFWIIVPVWLLSPKRECDACGLKYR